MKREEVTNHKSKKSIVRSIIFWLYTFVFNFVLVAFCFSLTNHTFLEIIKNINFHLVLGVFNGIVLATYLALYRIDASSMALDENDLENTFWLTPKTMKKLKEFKVYPFKKAEEMEDGIVIGAEKKGKDIEIVSTSQMHALIVGTTGSGKTTGFVDQNIEVLSSSKTKPSLVITDPKKELYEKHVNQLKKKGYKIKVLDLREPYSSTRWNPLNVLIRRVELVKELMTNLVNKEGRYYAAGEEFMSFVDARTRKQELLDEIYENAKDLVYTLCPIENKDQPNWESGARNLILGLVLAFCEDCIAGKMEEKQLTLFNIYHNITKYCKEDVEELKKYLIEDRDEYSKVRSLVNTVLITQDKTLTSYLSEVNSYMQQLTDEGILSLTSENELDILDVDESPTAVFVIIPDERVTRHRFVTLFITQLYKELVEKANLNLRRKETESAILKRNTYFILDEFGNLPRFENMDSMVTVSRSRGIRLLFILQSFSQLSGKYGKEIGDVIKTNCNVKLFIGSDDPETRREFSELCGQKKVKSFSVSSSMDRNASSSTGAQNQPLITVGMLERLNGDEKGDAIVSVRGYEAIWTRFTPSYELKDQYFSEGKGEIEETEANLFEKEKYVYDITGDERNKEEEYIQRKINEKDQEMITNEIKMDDKVKDLDNLYEDALLSLDEKIEGICIYLKEKDAMALREAGLKDKTILLYEFMRRYNQSIQLKLRGIAKFIEEKLAPRLESLNEMAVNGR